MHHTTQKVQHHYNNHCHYTIAFLFVASQTNQGHTAKRKGLASPQPRIAAQYRRSDQEHRNAVMGQMQLLQYTSLKF